MRVRVEFESNATQTIHGDYLVELPVPVGRISVIVSSHVVTVLGVEEPQEPGLYVVMYSSGVKTVVHRIVNGASSPWFQIGFASGRSWEELGNIIAIEKLNLDEPDRTSNQDSES